jgi:hypothetical protein
VTAHTSGTFATDLAAAKWALVATDASALPATATGSTTPRTLSARFSDVVNVRDFGAIGGGITDDRSAILAALAAAGPSGVVYFPAGTYYVSATIAIGTTSIVGAGVNATTICARPSKAHDLAAGGFDVITTTGLSRIAHMTIDGGWNGSTAGMTGDAVVIDNGAGFPYNVVIDDVWVQYACRNGVRFRNAGYSYINRVKCNACGLHGLSIAGDSDASQATTVLVTGQSIFSDCPNGYGINLYKVNSINCSSVISENTKGFRIESNANRSVTFHQCYQETTIGGEFLTLTGDGSGLTISDCFGGSANLSYPSSWIGVTVHGVSGMNYCATPPIVSDVSSSEVVATTNADFTALTLTVPPGSWRVKSQLWTIDAGSGAISYAACNITPNAGDSGIQNATNVNFRVDADYKAGPGGPSKELRCVVDSIIRNTTSANATYYLRAKLGITSGSIAWRAYAQFTRSL